jgi:pyruvate/2-oxoacid:ferredoxin oxidoreductase alpha subunit/NAD-dependent dihydropyrimidine dehydrogenase PreA subunit
MVPVLQRPVPLLTPELCKGCGRCVDSCIKGCLAFGTEIHPVTGLVPVVLDLNDCNGCGLCFDACPEPYALLPLSDEEAAELLAQPVEHPEAEPWPDRIVELPESEPLLLKGTNAFAAGALLAGCRHVFGYPITPSTEGAELMAKVLPEIGGIFIQAVSEVATVNMMYGAGGAGKRCMTFTSSPGFSLMLEGISYMIGAEVPGVFVDIMRGGPGLGNLGPEQADVKLACRGLGHGNTHAIVLAPATPQEMLELAMLSFELAFVYRNPVIVVGDAYLGQITGRVVLPRHMVQPGVPDWAVYGDHSHRDNLISSINLSEDDLERANLRLEEKYASMQADEQRADLYRTDDAEILLVACNTPAQLARGAVSELRRAGVAVGLFRPVTLWPFPVDALVRLLGGVSQLVVVEASSGQLEDEMRLALSHTGVHEPPPISHVRRMGGMLPSQAEIVEHVRRLWGMRSGRGMEVGTGVGQ